MNVVTGEGAEVEVEGIAGTREVEAGGKEGGQENNITWEKTYKLKYFSKGCFWLFLSSLDVQ